MNTKRIMFWLGFFIVLVLIIWGLIVAMNKPVTSQEPKNPAPATVNDHIFGKSDAVVTLIEYSDFQCPACRTYYYFVDKLLNSTTSVRVVYRHFPLPQHPNAIPAALAFEAASVQGKSFEMYKMIFENYDQWVELTDPKPEFVKYAESLGLNVSKFSEDMASTTLRKIIDDNAIEGQKIGINATPTFFVNGKFINNPPSYAEFEKLIRETATTTTQ